MTQEIQAKDVTEVLLADGWHELRLLCALEARACYSYRF